MTQVPDESDSPAMGDDSATFPPPPPPAETVETIPAAAAQDVSRAAAWRTRLHGVPLLLIGLITQFLLMASDKHFTFSVPVGFFAAALAALGLMILFGMFQIRDRDPRPVLTSAGLVRPLLEILLSGTGFLLLIRSAVAGTLPQQIMLLAVAVPALFLWLVVALFKLAQALGAYHSAPEPLTGAEAGAVGEVSIRAPWYRHHGFWLIALTTLAYLPMLGSFSLSDPWETHYGEVAREMLARDDWVSLWWAQDGWFWSKPILNFWLQGLSFSLFGVQYWPDQMLANASLGQLPQPEWAARLPVFLLSLLGQYILYKACARFFGRRAAFFGALVLGTTPYWFLISHQTMTDMPYVAPLSAAIAFLMLALNTDATDRAPESELRIFQGRVRLSGLHLLLFVALLSALPQVLYLATRNVTLQLKVATSQQGEAPAAEPVALSALDVVTGKVRSAGFRVHLDEISEGSFGGNCGLPGNSACKKTNKLANEQLQPALMAAFYSALLLLLLWINRRETSLKRVFYLAAWYATAVAAMAKGAPGLVLPLFVFGTFIVLRNNWRELTRSDLFSLLLITTAVCLPWFVQMFLRHGPEFINRLLLHDMYKRAFEHVHDTNQGDDVSFRYYLWQLGYGLFPWNGLCAAGLVWWFRRERDTTDATQNAALLLFIWAIGSFGMFTITLTKFHHYILPLVPALAMLAGLVLDECMGEQRWFRAGWQAACAYAAGIGIGVTLIWVGLSRFFAGSITGSSDGPLMAPRPALGAGFVMAGLVFSIGTVALFGLRKRVTADDQERFESRPALVAVGLAGAISVLLAGRDLVSKNSGDVVGNGRLMQLFTYQYKRPWPEHLNFNAAISAFTILAAVLFLVWLIHAIRPHVTTALCALSLVFATWGVNVYLVKCAPHWGQRETVLAYYQQRKSAEEPLIAYQMNWKGENFYTGNRLPAFVSSGKKFKNWIEQQRKKGVTVMFFTTEHSRLAGLKRELSNPKKFELLTDERVNNKFFLARVEFD